jgi:hypothetical protein
LQYAQLKNLRRTNIKTVKSGSMKGFLSSSKQLLYRGGLWSPKVCTS